MEPVESFLRRWLNAGVIDESTAQRIRAFEETSPVPSSTESRPGALEAVLYLGLVVLGVGVFALFAQQWQDLESWSRVLAIGVPTVLILGLGALLHTSKDPELRRGGQAAWFVSVGLTAGLIAVLVNEYGLGLDKDDDRGQFLLVASCTFLLAMALWTASPSHAQLLAIAGSAFMLGQAIGNWPDEFSQPLAGMTTLGIAVAAIALVELEWLSPAESGRFFFVILGIVGAEEAGAGGGPIGFELFAGVVAALAIAYGVLRESFVVVLVGVGGAFVVLVTFIFEHFQEEIGAPMALMISGGLLIAAVVILTVYRREAGGRATV
ncbi:MAG: DUF2157 domain-containing protein [Dehalococcoidia bacterium]